MQPVIPFEPIRVEEFPEGRWWVAQVKWDGVRMLAYLDGQTTRLVNRRLNERTAQYPELADARQYCQATSAILDGEVIALDGGWPSFYQVMRRDGVRRPDRIERVCRNIPVYYMVFDILYLNGRWVTDCPLAERQRLLADILRPHPHVHVVDNEPDAQALFQAVQARDMEGVVVKDLRSTYRIGGKDGRWRKKKWYRDRVVVVGGLVLRGGRAASLLLGLFDAQGRLWYIGHAGTGRLSERAWRELTADLLACRQAQPAFVNPPRTADVVWLRPVSTVRIIYTEWAQGHTLRQASVQSPVTVEAALCRLQPNDPVPGE